MCILLMHSVFVCEGDVGNRYDSWATVDLTGITIAIAKRIELLDVIKVQAGLRFDPASKATLQTGPLLRR